jgi:hypothetical protein
MMARELFSPETTTPRERVLLKEIERLKQIIQNKDAQIRQAYGYGSDTGKTPWMQ